MRKTLGELAQLVKGEARGDEEIEIEGVGRLDGAKKGEIIFVLDKRFLSLAKKSNASAVVVPLEIENFPKPFIRVKNPRLAFAQIMEVFSPLHHPFSGIHPSTFIKEGVKLGKEVSIGPYTVVEEDVEIGDEVYISSLCYLGKGVKVGEGSFLAPHVTLLEGTVIGKKVIIHPGAVIGADGFGFARREDGSYHKIPQTGIVVVEDEVEIGANVTIDRATIGETRIGKGTKIDNLVHIAHNVTIGTNVAIVALVGISGSSKIGDRVILAGQVGVTDHVSIGHDTIVAAKSGVTKNIPAGRFVSGFPARSHGKQKRIKASLNRVPELIKKVQALERKLNKLSPGKKR